VLAAVALTLNNSRRILERGREAGRITANCLAPPGDKPGSSRCEESDIATRGQPYRRGRRRRAQHQQRGISLVCCPVVSRIDDHLRDGRDLATRRIGPVQTAREQGITARQIDYSGRDVLRAMASGQNDV
jgi:hypothetical protein